MDFFVELAIHNWKWRIKNWKLYVRYYKLYIRCVQKEEEKRTKLEGIKGLNI